MRSRRARPGLHRPGERCGITITTTSSRPRPRQPTASGGVPNEIPALRFAPHRCAERAHRPDRVLARARHGIGEFRQRHVSLRAFDRLERVARAAVVSVCRGVPALLRLHAAAQRAYPDRRHRGSPVAPRSDVDRHLRHALLPAADGDLCHVALLADIHECLEQQRDLRQRGRPDPLAGPPSGSGRLLPAVASGSLRTDQAHRLPEGPDSGSAGKARGPAGTGHRARRSRKMTQFLIANMAPLMFAALVVFLLFGYPVSFALAAIGLSFGFLGIELGLLTPALFGALPERIFGIMSNDTLLAVPFFTFMGLILERSGMAEDLLDTIGQLFGPIRGGLAYAVIFVGALLAATTGVVAASVISMGLISLPIMLRYGYDRRLASGVIAASGTLAQIIPPSLVLIVLADQLGRSVGDMYAGAIFPGLVLTALYAVHVPPTTLLFQKLAPALPAEARLLRGWKLAPRVLFVLTPPLALIFLVLGTIFLGIATPTEGGAMGATGALALALINRRLSWVLLKQAMNSTAKLTSFVVFILVGATVFSLTFRGVNGDLWVEHLLTSLPGGQIGFLIVVNILTFLLAFFLDFRSEEHTSELQSLAYLVCRLLLEKKKASLKLHSYHRPSTVQARTASPTSG